MALAVATLLASLCDDDAEVRRAAVRALARGCARDDKAALDLVAKRVTDIDEDVRLEAVKGLTLMVGERGNATAVGVASQAVRDTDEHVRRAAVTALAELAVPGDSEVVELFVGCLRDKDSATRHEAADSLERGFIARRGDEAAVRLLMPLCGEAEMSQIRALAVRVLAHVAQRGDDRCLECAFKLCVDSDSEVRLAAARAVGDLALAGSSAASDVLLKLAEDDDEDVRVATLEALASISPPGDVAITTIAVRLLRDDDSDVRSAAVSTLRSVACRGSTEFTSTALVMANGEDEDLRFIGLRALSVLADIGNSYVLEVACERAHDSDEDVRRAAVQVLEVIAPRCGCQGRDEGDHGNIRKFGSALATVLERLHSDEDTDVRQAAAEATAAMAPSRDGPVTGPVTAALLRALTSDVATSVRCAAAASLEVVAGGNSDDTLVEVPAEVITALGHCFEDDSDDVRYAAANAVAALVGAGSTVAWGLLTSLLEDTDPIRRCRGLDVAVRLSGEDSAQARELLPALLGDADAEVREAAMEAVVALRVDETGQLLRAIGRHLDVVAGSGKKDNSVAVRITALEALARLVPKAGRDCVVMMTRGLNDPNKAVSDATVRLVGKFRLSVDEAVIAELVLQCAIRIEGKLVTAQQAAVAALVELCPRGDSSAIAVAMRCAVSNDAKIRRAAFQLLGPVSRVGDAKALEAAAAAIGDCNDCVREAAVCALRCIMGRSSASLDAVDLVASRKSTLPEAALAAVSPYLSHVDGEIRFSAARAVAAVALRGDTQATGALLPLTQDDDPDVRWAVFASLGEVAHRGDDGAVAAALRSLSDNDEQVQIAAIEALQRIALPGDNTVMQALKKCLGDTDVARCATSAMLALFTPEAAAEALSQADAMQYG
eukprot:TRINITY_DN31513_c0_g1_i1.p1 TRINITY_DN31513_c0_g1~~TRINITY_DN31513_c0_g1_i1.p1  ORF type:complete len:915 (-),score=180.45 TRINITY_DN31513_c0_g1_i1:89-2764(-)